MLNDIETHPRKEYWVSSVKSLLSRLGFLEIWLAQGIGNSADFLNVFRTRVKDIFTQDWHSRIENSSRARFYVTFTNFKRQDYSDCLKVDKFRKCFSRYSVPSHRLEIETGQDQIKLSWKIVKFKCKKNLM